MIGHVRYASFTGLLVALALASGGCTCGSDAGGKVDGGTSDGGASNTAPVVTLMAPESGASFTAGTSIVFEGSATDAEDGAITGDALAWSSDLDGALGLGGRIETALVTEGTHTITLTATDAEGLSGSASLTVVVTPSNVPTVTITSPEDGHQASIGESIVFRATVQAPPGADVANGDIVWTSSLDGQIGIGAEIRTGLATEGAHTITCTATDSAGESGSATVTVEVVSNHAPEATILEPADGDYFKPDQSIAFRGSAQDFEDGALTGASLVWRSDAIGQIGIGAQVTTALPLGDHVITLEATDTQGVKGEATITLHVVENIPPRCAIARPDDGDSFLEGQSIRFEGSCTDPESGAITTGLTWSSDVDGQIGLGAVVQTALPTTGAHVISLCAADPADAALTGCASVGIDVRANTPPTCAITAPTDGAVVSAGSPIDLRADASDAEDPSLTGQNLTYAWDSDGTAVADRRSATLTYDAADSGSHTLTLQVTDSGGLSCTASVSLFVNLPPTASIDSVTQGGSPDTPFATGTAIDLTGTGTDPDGDAVSLDWRDSLEGDFASGGSVSLAAPLMGRHLVTLTATDTHGGAGTDTTAFDVLPAGQGSLVEPYATVNTDLMGQSLQTRALAVTSADEVLLGNNNRQLYGFDGTSTAASPSQILGQMQLPNDINQILLDEADGLAYLATQEGLVVCDWSAQDGLVPDSCRTIRNGAIPDQNNDITAVARVTGSDGNDYLILGNADGLLVADNPAGSNDGTRVTDVRNVSSMAAGDGVVWIASEGGGLYRFDPVSGQLDRWRRDDGAPSDNLRAVAVGTGGAPIWVGASQRGLGRFDPATGTWTTWRQGDAPAPGLVADTVEALAIHHETIAGTARDIVWIGTGGGVSRFDPSIPSFMNLTVADGLPSNSVRAIVILSDGTKVFGTPLGVARYTGP